MGMTSDGGGTDLRLLDALCRAALAARRRGWAVALHTSDERLRALVELAGLTEVLRPYRSGQPQGQAQPDKDRFTEEGVDVGDPPA